MPEHKDQSSISSRLAAAMRPDEMFSRDADTAPPWPPFRPLASLSSPADYCRLADWLRKGTRRTISPATHLELLCPHTPPEDDDWPAPIDEVLRARLLSRLPHRQKAICALTAAEMALPVWLSRAPGQTTSFDPVRVLVWVRDWLEGRSSHEELSQAVPWDENFKGVPRDKLLMAVTSAAAAARVAVLDDVSDVERALTFAADACGIGNFWPHFLSDWWRHCRCRMPFRDALTAELQ
ncbi:MAG: hypothetical protein AB7K09_21100 [Planctomycetota bacterium]